MICVHFQKQNKKNLYELIVTEKIKISFACCFERDILYKYTHNFLGSNENKLEFIMQIIYGFSLAL